MPGHPRIPRRPSATVVVWCARSGDRMDGNRLPLSWDRAGVHLTIRVHDSTMSREDCHEGSEGIVLRAGSGVDGLGAGIPCLGERQRFECGDFSPAFCDDFEGSRGGPTG
jgi:hypothetical protein